MEQGENQSADNLVSSSDNNELEGNCTGLVAARFSKSHIIVNVTEKRGRKNSTTKKNAWHLIFVYTLQRSFYGP